MTTFWTGAALAADYGQHRVRQLSVATRPHNVLPMRDLLARRAAFDALNKAISRAVQAQLDDQQTNMQPLVSCLVDDDDDDLLMHCGGMECFFCALPDKRVAANCAAGL
ncbi:MAG TPA: hypothetical protein VLB90_00890 [Pseudomonadales bacterium]|nr:hypothetical protein [Pseudomonadales bacterium]